MSFDDKTENILEKSQSFLKNMQDFRVLEISPERLRVNPEGANQKI
jgi:hypothetical protein